MPKVKPDIESVRRRPPAKSIEARENQMIALAMDLAEKQIREGTAKSQVITHFLKLGTTRELREIEHLKQQTKLAEAKTKAVQSSERIEELYLNALDAMRTYAGSMGRDDNDN